MVVKRLKLLLPLPPSINHQYATVNGRRVLSWKARQYKRQITERLEKLGARGWISSELLDVLKNSYLALRFDFYFKTSLRRDLDGGLKIAQDVICEPLKINDNRVVQVQLNKLIDPQNFRLEAWVEALSSWDFHFHHTEETENPVFDLTQGSTRKGSSMKRERTLEELAKDFHWKADL